MVFGLHLLFACAQTEYESTYTPPTFLFPNKPKELGNTANLTAK